MKPNIAPSLKKHLPTLLEAQKNKLNEADTSVRVLRIFEQVLGYDALKDISHETPVKYRYSDLAIKIESQTAFLVEVKAAAVKLSLRFVDQGNWYAANTNIKWVLLTNGVDWNLYHLTWDQALGIKSDLVFAVTLASETLARCADTLAILHRTSVKNGGHEAFWRKKNALNPASLGHMLFSEDVIRFLRRKVWQREKVTVEMEDVAEAIQSLFSDDAKQKIGPAKIRRLKPLSPVKSDPPADAPPVPLQSTDGTQTESAV